MTVTELIEYLQTLPGETRVMILYADDNHELDMLDAPFAIEKVMSVHAEYQHRSGVWKPHHFYEKVSDGRNRNEEGANYKCRVLEIFDALVIE